MNALHIPSWLQSTKTISIVAFGCVGLSVIWLFMSWYGFTIFSDASITDGTVSSSTAATDRYAWSENVGWVDFGTTEGDVHVTDSALTGYAWGENVGWISLNCSNTASCGTVNYSIANDGEGNLSGYAWGENVGWIQFNPTNGGVTITSTGDFYGYAWGENIGWLAFNCADTNTCGTVDHKVSSDWLPQSARPACNNGLDDDSDGLTDHGADPGCASLTDTSEDNAGTTLSTTSLALTEGGVTGSYTVAMSALPTDEVTLTLASGSDVTTSPTSLIFTTSTWNVAQTVTVSTLDDTTVEGTHTDTVSHTASSTDTTFHGLTVSSVTVTITDNDTATVTTTATTASSDSNSGGSIFFPTPITTESGGPPPDTISDVTNTVTGAAEISSPNASPTGATPNPSTEQVLEVEQLTASTGETYFGVIGEAREEREAVDADAESIMLIKGANSPFVYVLYNNQKFWIPTEEIFLARGYSFDHVVTWSQVLVDRIADGGSLRELVPDGRRVIHLDTLGADTASFVSAAEISLFDTDLSEGSQSLSVRRLQRSLQILGYFPRTAPPTAIFGPITNVSVRAFQRSQGLEETGILEATTREALNSFLNL